MTDIMEARRKGFEEFYLTQDVEADAHLNFIRDDGEYGYHVTRMAWCCWNQAIDSIFVELPSPPDPRGGYSDYEYGISRGIDFCRESIERAGLKVKL